MSDDALKNRESLRTLIEGKLQASASTQAELGTRLREELSSNYQRLVSIVGATLTELGQQQKERLEGTTQALVVLSERHEKSHEALKGTVDWPPFSRLASCLRIRRRLYAS
jgi:DNA recombination protein RmuC